jgi:tetratricopeptide (TPR) repeat protein
LIIGLGTSTWLLFMERAARERAVAAEKQAEQARLNEAQLRRLAETREKITQATVLINQEKFDEADQLMSDVSVTEPTVEGSIVFRALGEYHALRNQWKEAAARFNVLVQINQLDGWDACTLDYLRYGPTLIEQGDKDGYERFRQAAIDQFSSGKYPFADRIVKISLLLPANEKLLKSLAPLAGVTTQSIATNADANADIFLAAWRSVSTALMEYRCGNFEKAAGWCQQSLSYPEHIAPRTATARIILAMSDQKLGKTNEARSQLEEAREIIENKFKSQLDLGTPMQGFWFDWVFARVLLNEAAALVEGSPKNLQIH